VNLVRALREGAGTSADTHNIRFRRGLLVVEAAFAVLLLAGATLLTRGFTRLLNTDTGYDAANVLTARISLQGIPNPERWQQLATAVLERLRSVPGVGAAGAASMAPLGDSTFVMGFHLAGDRPVPVIARALGYVVTPGYAETLHLRLRQGRLLAVTDIGAKTQAIVVNEEFVKTYLNDGQPVVGRQYANMLMPNGITEIVGVVGNVLKNGLIDTPRTEFYVALGSQGVINVGREINLLVRTAGDPRSFADTLRQAVREVDRNAPVHNINVLAAELSATAGEARFATIMLGAFAALAVGLAAIGLYGVLAYGVTSRRREIGVRLALGASRANLFALVMREGIGVTCAGLLVGLGVAAAVTRLMRSLLFGIDSLDLISFMVAPLILIVVALCACLLPAWRASSIDPLIALRHE
jgi:putative ABC transport system permease protein